MGKISYIFPEDIAGLEQDKDGNYLVPDGFEIYRTPTMQEKMDKVQAEIDRIEAMPEPSERELIEWARENHEYYFETNTVLPLRKADLEYLKTQRDGV